MRTDILERKEEILQWIEEENLSAVSECIAQVAIRYVSS